MAHPQEQHTPLASPAPPSLATGTAAAPAPVPIPGPGHERHGSLAFLAARTARPRTWKERLFPPRRPTLVLDPDRCTGCGLCEAACAGRDGGEPSPDTARIQILRGEDTGANFAVFCQHCLEPLCRAACPQQAVRRGPDGVVAVDPRLCVHCGLCQAACAEAAPRRGPDGLIRKCDLCGGAPRCVPACPHQALAFSRGKAAHWIKYLRWPVQALSFLLLVVVLTGTICSLSIAAASLGCPLGALQNVLSSRFILGATLISASILIALTLVAGRFFCGWLCPFGFMLDLAGKVLPQGLFRGRVLPAFLRTRLAKYGVAGGTLAASGALGYQAFCTVCPIGTVCRAYGFQAVVGGAELAIIPAVAALEVSEKRSWCRYFCPVGALLGLCAKIGLVKISIGASRCKKFSCLRCAQACPMGIISADDLRQGKSPRLDMAECIGCLRCVDICPHGAAVIRFAWQKATPTERAGAERAGAERAACPAGNPSGGTAPGVPGGGSCRS